MLKFDFTRLKPMNMVFRTVTPVDEFHFDTVIPTHCCKKAVVVTNPIYVLFNAQRLSSVGQFNIDEWIAGMNNVHSDSFKELRSKISDEDLISYMKSRYCQKPSDIAQWASYLASRIDEVQDEVQQFIQAQQLEKTGDNNVEVVQKTD